MSKKLPKTKNKAQDPVLQTTNSKLIAIQRGKRLSFLHRLTGFVAHAFSTLSFGTLCGVGRTTISSWEQGINPLTERGAAKVVEGVRKQGISCTTLWLLHGIGEAPKITHAIEYSNSSYQTLTPSNGDKTNGYIKDYSESKLTKEISLFKSCYSDHLVYRMQDNTLYPGYYPGDWVGGIILSQQTLDLANDMDCITQLQDGKLIARRVQVENTNTLKFNLYSTHAKSSIVYPPLKNIPVTQTKAIAPIVRVWRTSYYEFPTTS